MAATDEEPREAVDVEEAARRLRLDRDTVRLAAERGWIDGYRDDDGAWRVWLKGPQEAAPDGEAASTSGAAPADSAAGSSPGAAASADGGQAGIWLSERAGPLASHDEATLRDLLARREADVASKDALIGELAREAMRLARGAVARLPQSGGGETAAGPTTSPPDQQRLLESMAESLRAVRELLEKREREGR